jgi:hypothetical protein
MTTPSADKRVQQIGSENKRHLTRLRNLRYDLLSDETANPVDRVSLGMTGSSAIHQAYKHLEQVIGRSEGEPLIVVRYVRGPQVTRALGGIIAGEVQAHFEREYVTSESERTGLALPTHAFLRVPVNRSIDYALYNYGWMLIQILGHV